MTYDGRKLDLAPGRRVVTNGEQWMDVTEELEIVTVPLGAMELPLERRGAWPNPKDSACVQDVIRVRDLERLLEAVLVAERAVGVPVEVATVLDDLVGPWCRRAARKALEEKKNEVP